MSTKTSRNFGAIFIAVFGWSFSPVRLLMDLFDRKKFGDDTVDEKSVQKHLKEFWRLATILTGDEEITSTGQPQKDMTLAIAKVALRPASQFKQVMEKIPGITMKPIMTALKKIFLRT